MYFQTRNVIKTIREKKTSAACWAARSSDIYPQQPRAGRKQDAGKERIQAKEVDVVEIEGGQGRHAAGRGDEGGQDRGGEVVAAAGLAEGKVGVPGQGLLWLLLVLVEV